MGVSNQPLEGLNGSRRRLFRGGACLSLAALAGAGLYRFCGHDLVRSLYRGEWPWLSHLVKRRGEHPVEHYLEIADRAVYGLLLWSVLVFLLYWALRELGGRLPAWLPADPWWRRLTIASAAVWLLFLLRIPLFQALPWWFWSLEDKPLPLWWLFAPLAAAGAGVVYAVSSRPRRRWQNLLLLMALCYALQLGFGLMEGRGLQSLSDRLTGSGGHARLALAGTVWTPGHLLRFYPSMVADQELPHFPHATRPPGPVIAFALLDQLAGYLPISGDDRRERAARLAALLFPLMATLTLLPLWGLSRLAVPGERESWTPLLLYVSAPSLLLMVLHLDQCLFPLIATTCLYLVARALAADRLLPAFAAGSLPVRGAVLQLRSDRPGGRLGSVAPAVRPYPPGLETGRNRRRGPARRGSAPAPCDVARVRIRRACPVPLRHGRPPGLQVPSVGIRPHPLFRGSQPRRVRALVRTRPRPSLRGAAVPLLPKLAAGRRG